MSRMGVRMYVLAVCQQRVADHLVLESYVSLRSAVVIQTVVGWARVSRVYMLDDSWRYFCLMLLLLSFGSYS